MAWDADFTTLSVHVNWSMASCRADYPPECIGWPGSPVHLRPRRHRLPRSPWTIRQFAGFWHAADQRALPMILESSGGGRRYSTCLRSYRGLDNLPSLGEIATLRGVAIDWPPTWTLFYSNSP